MKKEFQRIFINIQIFRKRKEEVIKSYLMNISLKNETFECRIPNAHFQFVSIHAATTI